MSSGAGLRELIRNHVETMWWVMTLGTGDAVMLLPGMLMAFLVLRILDSLLLRLFGRGMRPPY